ncbi:unnamed protein product [Urochloa decumbens]|uniref:SAC domain-containing protein n=2 Tax=Urochloa decumbens TaxID=240449 RepID=A0ABC8WVN8_9POAL
MFYFVGRDDNNQMWRVLKVDRSEPTSLSLVQDPTCYVAIERDDLLRRIHAGNKATGGLKRIDCHGIVGFVKFLGPYYMLLITESCKIGTILGHDIYSVHKSQIIPIPAPHLLPSVAKSNDEKRYLKQLHSVDLSKDFFYSFSYNLAQTLEKNMLGSWNDTTFVWNEFLTEGIWEQISSPIWTVALVHGFFRQETLSISANDFQLTIIARRSRHFAGPRFFKRGVNDDGNVANDVETEQIVFEETRDEIPCQITSVVQRRGSIPLPWSQETTKYPIKPGILLKSDKDFKATRLHFENLQARYANPVIVLNLIKTVDKKPNELLLRREYAKGIEHINKLLPMGKRILFVHMDMSNHSLRGDVLPYLLSVGSASLKQTGIFHCKVTPNSESEDTACEQGDTSTSSENSNLTCVFFRESEVAVAHMCVSPQKGVLRTNCLDCLDRTNVAQFAYGLAALESQLNALGLCEECEISVDNPVSHTLMDIYGQMGDALSRQYAGSAAQNKVFWEQRGQCTMAIKLKRNIRNIGRFVSNVYMDSEKQNALNVFLGLLRPQQGEPSGSPNICGRQENPRNEEYESEVHARQVVAEEQNCPSEPKYEKLFYSNFVDPFVLSNAGKFREVASEG